MKKLCSSLIVMLLALAPWCGVRAAFCYGPDTVDVFPYVQDFEQGLPAGWDTIDADADSLGWMGLDSLLGADGYLSAPLMAHSGSGAMASLSSLPVRGMAYWRLESRPLTTENHLLTPRFVLPDRELVMSFYLAAIRPGTSADTIEVSVAVDSLIDSGTYVAVVSDLVPQSTGYTRIFVDMAAYAGHTVRFDFVHRTTGAYAVLLDDFAIDTAEAPRLAIEGPSRVMLGDEARFRCNVTNGVDAAPQWRFDGARVVDVAGSPATAVWDSVGVFEVTLFGTNAVGTDSVKARITVADCAVEADAMPYIEGFEDSARCWTFVDADGDGYGWTLATGNDAFGGTCYVESASLTPFGPLTPDNWMVSPPVDVVHGAYLSWRVAAGSLSHPCEHYSVYAIADGDTSVLFSTTVDTVAGYDTVEISLAEYEGRRARFAFRHHESSGESSLLVDEVRVGGLLAVDAPVAAMPLIVWPNPTTGTLHVEIGEWCEISVYSVLGKLMGKFTNNVIELSEFPSGVYFVTVTSDSGIATAKILKK